MAVLDSVDWFAVRRHYDDRVRVHKYLVELHQDRSLPKFANLALGITNQDGNYSAAEHGLGPKILVSNGNSEKQVFDLASTFVKLDNARRVPELIRNAQIKFLQISVGSEISCMINPKICWVANTRTIWTHLIVKHADNVVKADQELKLYREADGTSEMAYQMWAAIHAELSVALMRIAELGATLAKASGVEAGEITYLWADAIASHLYGMHH